MPRPPPPPSSCCGRKSAAAAVSRHVAVATWDLAWRWAPACHRQQRHSHDATRPSAGAPSSRESGTAASGALAGTMPTRGQGPAAKAAAAVQTLRDLIRCPLVLPPPPDPSPYGGGETPRDPAPARRSICSHLSWLVNHLQERRPPTARSLPGGEPQAGMGTAGRAGSARQKRWRSSRSTKEQSRNDARLFVSSRQSRLLGGTPGKDTLAEGSWAGSPAPRLARHPQRRGWSSPKAIPVYSSSRAPRSRGWFCSTAHGSCHRAGAVAGAAPAQGAVAGAAHVPPEPGRCADGTKLPLPIGLTVDIPKPPLANIWIIQRNPDSVLEKPPGD